MSAGANAEMTPTAAAASTPRIQPPAPGSVSLWERQVAAILALELRKSFFSGRAMIVYVLAALPLAHLPFTLFKLVDLFPLTQLTDPFSYIYEGLILRMIVFFGCAWIFSNLFRTEVLDRSLHYYFLVPVRREVIAVGKYLAGTLGAIVVFCTGTVLAYLSLCIGNRPAAVAEHLLIGAGRDLLFGYVGATALACIGYGAVFLVAGLYVKNPFIPAMMIWVWEWSNFMLPPFLQKISIVHHVSSLCPVPFDEGLFALVAEPVPPAVSVLGVLALSGILLVVAALKLRKMEVSYGVD